MYDIDSYLATNPVLTPSVVGYPVKGKRVLLGLRKKVSGGLGPDLIAGIGGKVGDCPELAGETNEQALLREVWEEIRISVLVYKPMGTIIFLFPHKPKWNQLTGVYLIEKWLGIPEETEAMRPQWFRQRNLPVDTMWDDNRYWVPRVLEGKQVEGIFMFDEQSRVIQNRLTVFQ